MPDRSDGTIEQARLTVQFPPSVDLSGPNILTNLYPATGGVMQAAGQQATVTVNGPLAAGQDFEARIQWPHGIIAGAPAGWQVYDDQWRPRVTLALATPN